MTTPESSDAIWALIRSVQPTTNTEKSEFEFGDEVRINDKFTGTVDDPDKWVPLKGYRPEYLAAYVRFARPHRPSEWSSDDRAPWLLKMLPASMGAWFRVDDLRRWNPGHGTPSDA